MAEVAKSFDVRNSGNKRKQGKKKGKMANKKQRTMHRGSENKVKVDMKMKKLFQKRARDYNSDEEDEEKDAEDPLQHPAGEVEVKKFCKRYDEASGEVKRFYRKYDEPEGRLSDDGEEEDPGFDAEEVSEDENGAIQPGITRFTEGIKAFKLAFKKIIKKKGNDEDVLGPVLSAHKMLLAEKLAEEEAEKKVKGAVRKEKHLIGEKGHVIPANYLDSHEKFLLGVATKGVVKLFNAVNKAQNAQKGLNPSRSKDEKVIKMRRKEAFFSELGRTPNQSAATVIKVGGGSNDGEAPAWAPLRDNYMLTNPKLKDWDKMEDTNDVDDFRRPSDADSSSDDD